MHYTEIKPEDLLESKIKLQDIDPVVTAERNTKIFKTYKTKLSPWYLFMIYYLSNSANKAVDYLQSVGVVGRTGKKLTTTTVLLAVWEWLIKNPEYARIFIRKDHEIIGTKISDEEINLILIHHALTYKQILTDKKLIVWMEKNNLTDKVYIDAIKEKRPEVYRYFQTRNI